MHTQLLVQDGKRKAALDEAAKLVGIERHAPKRKPDVVIDLDAALAAQAKRKAAAQPIPVLERSTTPITSTTIIIDEERADLPVLKKEAANS